MTAPATVAEAEDLIQRHIAAIAAIRSHLLDLQAAELARVDEAIICHMAEGREPMPSPAIGTDDDSARAAGWRIGATKSKPRNVICPECAGTDEEYWDRKVLSVAAQSGMYFAIGESDPVGSSNSMFASPTERNAVFTFCVSTVSTCSTRSPSDS